MGNEFLIVAEQVLQLTREPMTTRGIIDYADKNGMLSHKIAGKTPHKSLGAELSLHIRDTPTTRSSFVPGRDISPFGGYWMVTTPFIKRDRFRYRLRKKEKTLVFPSTWLDGQARFQGINPSWKRLLKDLLSPSICLYMNRLQAESNDDFKQILTYVMVTRGTQVLAYTRGKLQSRRGISAGFAVHRLWWSRHSATRTILRTSWDTRLRGPRTSGRN